MGKGRDRSKAPWTIYSDRGIAHLYTSIAGKRCRPSLGLPYDPATTSARDVRAIEAAAAEKYAELVAGRVLEAGAQSRIMTSRTLHELCSLWLVEAEKLWPRGYKTRICALGAVEAWATEAPRFAKDKRAPLERLVDDAGVSQFIADRLGEVLRVTVSGELSNLYAFFDWTVREGHLRSPPPRPKLPRGAQGVRSGPQRSQPVDITRAEAIAICNAMPEWSSHGGKRARDVEGERGIRVRDVFRLSWELALRPGIAQKISVPQHYVRGQNHVWISRDIDKIGLERKIPLTKMAKKILERCAPESGLIFGVHELTYQIKAAAKLVLSPEKAKHFARYDFRHGRAVHTLEVTGDLIGTQALMGHLQATTTNRYIRTREAHTAKVIASLDADADAHPAASIMPASKSDVCREDKTMAASPVKRGSRVEKPEGTHSPRAQSHSTCQNADLRDPRGSRCDDGRSASKNTNEVVTGRDGLPASVQHDVLTDLQRSITFTRSLEAMHDPYYALMLALEDDEVDS